MKAIQVKYIGPTNTKPSRWKAWAYNNKPLYVQYRHEDQDGGAEYAAKAFMERMGWNNYTVQGFLPNGDHVFCMVQS